MRRAFSSIGLGLCVIVLLQVPATARAQHAPFRVAGEGSVSNPFGHPFLRATGDPAPHLGRWYASGRVFDQWQLEATEPMFVAGHLFFRSANGHELWTTFVVVLDPSTGLAAGDFAVRGGTGRFADATGGGDATFRFFDLLPATEEVPFVFSFEGMIDY
jgi:hypothetical protein